MRNNLPCFGVRLRSERLWLATPGRDCRLKFIQSVIPRRLGGNLGVRILRSQSALFVKSYVLKPRLHLELVNLR